MNIPHDILTHNSKTIKNKCIRRRRYAKERGKLIYGGRSPIQTSCQKWILVPRPIWKRMPYLNFSTQAQIALLIPEALCKAGLTSQPKLLMSYMVIRRDFYGASPLEPKRHNHLAKGAPLTFVIGCATWQMGLQIF